MLPTDEHAILGASKRQRGLEARFAAYMAATGVAGSFMASEAEAVVIGNDSVQPFGINEEVNIDFNSDGQIDYQIDHDRVDLNGNDLDYLQIDKNDVSSAANPLPIDTLATFPLGVGAANDTADAKYVTSGPGLGLYPAALTQGTSIGPTSPLDFQEGNNFNPPPSDRYIRVNRLIDEDAGQIDADAGFAIVDPLPDSPNFVGLGGEVRYLGVQMDFNSAGSLNYGWIGIEITNEADATGNVVGWAYETTPNTPIRAGEVPEPGTIIMSAVGGAFLVGGLLTRMLFGRRRN